MVWKKLTRGVFVATLSALLPLAAAAQSGQHQHPAEKDVKASEPSAKQSPAPTMTRAEQLEAWGVGVDPGPDPDPKQIFERNGRPFTIEKFPMKNVVPTDRPGWVRPYAWVNVAAEIYRQDEQNVWVWLPADVGPTGGSGVERDKREERIRSYKPEELEYFRKLRPEFVTRPAPSADLTLRFEDASKGLPAEGNYRNSLAVADMNEDGIPDIILPPQRGVDGPPTIYLGSKDGSWREWKEAEWPYTFAYGSVVAGDLNGDGHQDLVFGVHYTGVTAILGDGKGHFVPAGEGLPTRDFGSRRVDLADFNGDGSLDIVAISEGPRPGRPELEANPIRIFLNQDHAKSWKELDFVEPGRLVSGDWMAVGDFDGNRKPDVAGSSIYFNGPDLIYLNQGKNEFKAFGRGFLPFYSYYFAVDAGHFTTRRRDDLAISFMRAWPEDIDPRKVEYPEATKVAGIDLVTWDAKGHAHRKPVTSRASDGAIWGMASADFDGDGKLDLIYSQSSPRAFVILLGDGKGNFREAKLDGLTAPDNLNYDIVAKDVNGDGRPDVVVMYEDFLDRKDGSVHVYLNRGAEPDGKGGK
ncbi:MAG: VCBS repeat-containing protein [Thermoanaerobaculia bacterium]